MFVVSYFGCIYQHSVSGDEGPSRNVKLVILGVGCIAGIAGASYVSYKVYNHVLNRPYRPALHGSAGEGPTITDVSKVSYNEDMIE